MVSICKIVNKVADAGVSAFGHAHLKAPIEPENTGEMTSEISKKASDAATNYAKAVVKKTLVDRFLENGELDREFAMQRMKKLFSRTRPSDTISIESAVRELNVFRDIQESEKVDLIAACVFNKEGEIVVSRPAVFMTKYAILDNGEVPRGLKRAIKSALDDEKMTFSDDKFYDLFEATGWRIAKDAHFKDITDNYSNIKFRNTEVRSKIVEVFNKENAKRVQNVKVKAGDIFKPLDEVSEEISAKLDKLVKDGENISPDLQKAMKKALSEYNFDMEEVFVKHYSLLNDCETLEEVSALYPELKYPKRPVYDPTGSKISLRNRLAQGNFDKSMIEGLKRLYLELLPNSKAYVNIEGSTPTKVTNLKNAGLELSEPSKAMLEFLSECKTTQNVYKKISKMSEETFEPHIKKHALRTSGVWTDYYNLTTFGQWMPVRLIKNKRLDPYNSKYSTRNLVETYLFNLYQRNPYKQYRSNPLSKFDNTEHLNTFIQNIISTTYTTKYLSDTKSLPAPTKFIRSDFSFADFHKFKSQFDLEAMGKSFEHLEEVYHRHFFRNYWSPARKNKLQEQMQKSYDLAYEKVIWGEQIRACKTVGADDVERLIKSADGITGDVAQSVKIDEEKFRYYQYLTFNIKDTKLKERFQSAIAQGRESDIPYFESLNEILQESAVGNKINELKAEALLNIRDAYLNDVLSGTQNLTEKEFRAQFLEKYKTPDGYDYAKIKADTMAESKYIQLSSKLMDDGNLQFMTCLNTRYREDYKGINDVMEKYMATPSTFREKFASIYTGASERCPNEVLEREVSDFYDRVSRWHFDEDERIIFGQDKLAQEIVIPKETKAKLWELSAGNYDTFDEVIQKVFQSGKKRTGDQKGTGIKTWVGNDYDAEIKILGKWGGYRLLAQKATPEDIEKYGNVKYVFKDAVKEH